MSPTLIIITKYSIFPLQSQFLLKTTRFRTTKKWVWKPKSRLYSITSAFCLNRFWHFENDSHLSPKFLKNPIIPYTLIYNILSYLTTWSSAAPKPHCRILLPGRVHRCRHRRRKVRRRHRRRSGWPGRWPGRRSWRRSWRSRRCFWRSRWRVASRSQWTNPKCLWRCAPRTPEFWVRRFAGRVHPFSIHAFILEFYPVAASVRFRYVSCSTTDADLSII